MKNLHNQQESTSEIKRRHTAWRNGMVVGVLLLLALAMGSSVTDTSGHVTTKSIIWVVATCGAFALLLVSLFISYRQSDERQQSIQTKAAALSLMAVVMSLLTTQMLHAINVINLSVALQIIFIGSILLWNVLVGVLERRIHL